jgi:hypothetical protein
LEVGGDDGEKILRLKRPNGGLTKRRIELYSHKENPMDTWRKQFKIDPLPPLLSSGNVAVQYFARRDLLGERVGPVSQLWQLPEARKILKKQKTDGSWPRAGKLEHPAINYGLIETWRWFRFLVEQYGFTREQPQAEKAAGFLFSCQTTPDFRGILANQYATYYSGAIMSLLIKAGYADDPRIERGFQWLLAMRQDDHGWTIPMITHKLDRQTQYRLSSEYAKPVEPDRLKLFSHNATGMILRAFAAHRQYRKSMAAKTAVLDSLCPAMSYLSPGCGSRRRSPVHPGDECSGDIGAAQPVRTISITSTGARAFISLLGRSRRLWLEC